MNYTEETIRNLKKTHDGWSLITGASSGIGKGIVCELAAQKFDLIFVARSEDALEGPSHKGMSRHGIRTRVVAMDLVRNKAPRELHSRV
ncbi:SDR family NAD(P)-dependent oxidoreductase [Yoonia sp. BS5-3]|uniref:SDR family NAD(P)-dependent oxidoreductase n=1 Tax=Yoonia phaeophyticola TaxID=3137369 RepID=A0ABZ3IEN8_9RHOB